jgi:hypothetical protein
VGAIFGRADLFSAACETNFRRAGTRRELGVYRRSVAAGSIPVNVDPAGREAPSPDPVESITS